MKSFGKFRAKSLISSLLKPKGLYKLKIREEMCFDSVTLKRLKL